jgi:hypothetical protein
MLLINFIQLVHGKITLLAVQETEYNSIAVKGLQTYRLLIIAFGHTLHKEK